MLAVFPIFYLLLVIGIGLSHRRPMADEADFFLARRSGGTLLLTGSLLATTLGSFGVMGVAGLGYLMGLVGGWYLWVGVFGLLALGLWVLRRVDIEGVYTLPELLGRTYGQPVRVVSAALIVLAWLSIIAAQLIAAGKILHFMGMASGWWTSESIARELLIIAVALVFVVYTGLGGQHSILRTDLFQAVVIVVALVVLIFSALSRHPNALAEVDPSFLSFPFNESLPPRTWFVLMLTFGVPFLVGPDIYSRVFSGRDRATGRRAVVAAALLMIPIVFGIAFAGVLARAILGGGMEDADTAILSLATLASSPFWPGLLVAALLAAVMSSADTCLLTVSTLLSRDLLDVAAPQLRREHTFLRRSRLLIAGTGFAALVIALWLQDIVSALLICYKLYSPAVLCPFLASILVVRHRFSIGAGLSAVLAGGGCAALGILLENESLQLIAFGASAVPLAADWVLARTGLRRKAR